MFIMLNKPDTKTVIQQSIDAEDFVMTKNTKKLKERYHKSVKSGSSPLVI